MAAGVRTDLIFGVLFIWALGAQVPAFAECNEFNLIEPPNSVLSQRYFEDQFTIGNCYAYVAAGMIQHELSNQSRVSEQIRYIDPMVLNASYTSSRNLQRMDNGGYIQNVVGHFMRNGYCDPSQNWMQSLGTLGLSPDFISTPYTYAILVHGIREEIEIIKRRRSISFDDAVDILAFDTSYQPQGSLASIWSHVEVGVRNLVLFLKQSEREISLAVGAISGTTVCDDTGLRHLYISTEPAIGLIEQHIPDLLNFLYTQDCDVQHFPNPLPSLRHYSPEDLTPRNVHHNSFLEIANRELSQGSVVGLSVCSDFLDGPVPRHLYSSDNPLREAPVSVSNCAANGTHALILAGMRRAPSGSCEVLLRNSWGPRLTQAWGPPAATSCYCQHNGQRNDCSRTEAEAPDTIVLGCWYDSHSVSSSTYGMDYFE